MIHCGNNTATLHVVLDSLGQFEWNSSPHCLKCHLCCLFSFRYLFLLAGGGVLALAAMGPYALLIFISALCAVALVSLSGPQEVHRLTFSFQMGWQTLCHLGLHYTEYYLQEPAPVR